MLCAMLGWNWSSDSKKDVKNIKIEKAYGQKDGY